MDATDLLPEEVLVRITPMNLAKQNVSLRRETKIERSFPSINKKMERKKEPERTRLAARCGVATISRLPSIIGLFSMISSLS